MVYFAWDPALETGQEMLDAEHKSLFALANTLEAAIEERPDDQSAVADAVYGLIGYVVEHFNDEEALMREYRYPVSGPHRALHERLSTETLAITARYMNGEDVMPAELAPLVCIWLTDHIRVHDMALVTFLQSADAAADAAANAAAIA
jgi:hemerythrin